jgi:aminopeptidase N
MDEGFTSYISHLAMNEVMDQKKVNPSAGGYKNYYYLVQSGFEDPLSMHADRFNSNFAYGISAYYKGEVFLAQLGYVIGKENLRKTIKKYFQDFEFKHPVPNDIKRTAEIVSGIELDWYLNYWTQSTNTIDYSVKSIDGREIHLENIGTMPMPIDLTVTYMDGTKENINIPLRMMYDHKPTKATVLDAWPWVQPIYSFSTSKMVKSVIIDPLQDMADINKKNNLLKAK